MPFFSTMLASALPALISGGMGMMNKNKMAGIPQPGPAQAMAPAPAEQLGTGLGTFGGRMLGSLANRGMGAMGDKIFGQGEAKRAGERTNTMNKAAFPGTNAWEQLGAGGSSATASMSNQRAAERMQDKDLANKVEVAKITTAPAAAQAGVAQAQSPSNIKSQLASAASAYANARNTGHIAKMNEAKAKFSQQLARADLSSAETRSIVQAVFSALGITTSDVPGLVSKIPTRTPKRTGQNANRKYNYKKNLYQNAKDYLTIKPN